MARGIVVFWITIAVALAATGCRDREKPAPAPPPPPAHVDPLDTVQWQLHPLQWSRPVIAPARDLSGYAGSLACKACHEQIYASYAKHSMARTGMRAIDKVDQPWIRKLFDVGGQVEHARSGFVYRPVRRGNRYFVDETVLGSDGSALATWEEPVTHVFSAGSYGLALFSRRGTKLVHLPIDYYAQAGRWDLDPMAFGGNPRMNVALDTYCISCHSDDVAKRFDDPLPGGVGCERCHGPSKKHIDTLKKEDTVNPKRLAARRQLEVCAECHQSTFPVLRPGRDHFGFRPGEVLDEFRVSFLGEPAEPDRVKLLAHAERLVRSACWRGAPDKLTCTTCHDPHVSSIDEPASWWDKPCLQCHDPKSCTDTAEHRAAAGDHCARCHMRRGQTANLPLVAITDHWIQKKPPPINPQLVEKPHAIVPWSAQIGEPVKDGMTGLAAVANADAGLTDEAERLAIEAVHDRPTPQVWNVLANAFLARHREPDAGRAYQQALELDLDDTTALLGYARAMLDANRVADARKAFDRLLAIDPEDVAALETLGIQLHRSGDVAGASALFEKAVATGRASGISYVGLAAATTGADRRTWLELAWRAEPRDRWIVESLAAESSTFAQMEPRIGALTTTLASSWLPHPTK